MGGYVVGGAVAALHDCVVVDHDFASKPRAGDGTCAVWEKDEADLKIVEVEAELEEAGCAGCYHGPDCILPGAVENEHEDVFFEEEF